MSRRRVVGGAALLVAAAGVALYFTQLPGKIADDYESRAGPGRSTRGS